RPIPSCTRRPPRQRAGPTRSIAWRQHTSTDAEAGGERQEVAVLLHPVKETVAPARLDPGGALRQPIQRRTRPRARLVDATGPLEDLDLDGADRAFAD